MKSNEKNIDPQLDIAKALIMEFIAEEYDGGELRPFDYMDLGKIEIAYTTTEDGEHEIQVVINLIEYSLNQYIDEELVDSTKYGSLDNLIKYELRYLSFDDLVCVDVYVID